MAGGERKRGGGLRPRPGRARGVLGTVFGVILAGALGTVVVGMLRLGGARDVSLSGSIRQPPTGLPSTWNFVPAMGHGKAGADIQGAKTGEGDTGRQRAPPGEERSRKGAGVDGLRKGVAQQGSTQGVEGWRGGGGLVSASDRGGASEATLESESIPDRYHVVLSTGGGGRALWQDELCYYWYLQAKREHPDSAMGGFTRLLHASRDDALSRRIPTLRVDPSALGKEALKNYPVLARPLAFKMLMELDDNGIEEDYVMMIENDHFFLKPVPNWATPTRPAAYPFHYMVFDDTLRLLKKFNRSGRPLDARKLAPSGSSPTIIHKKQLAEIVQLWPELTVKFSRDAEVEERLGWVKEMYSFVLAAATVPSGPIEFTLRPDFMLEPPWDKNFSVNRCISGEQPPCPKREAYIIHYTYALNFDKYGEVVPGTTSWVGRTAFHFSAAKMPHLPHIKLSRLPPMLKEKQPLSWRLFEMLEEATRKLRSGEAKTAAAQQRAKDDKQNPLRRKYHVVVVAGGDSGSRWQTEVCYYWYRNAISTHPGSALGGFTRLLHSDEDDSLSSTIRTVRVGTENSLKHQALKKDPSLARPLAFRMLVDMEENGIEEDYILMLQPDHIISKPPRNWATPTHPAAFPLFHLDFSQPRHLVEKYNKRNLPTSHLPRVGSAPTIIHKKQLRELAHVWADLTVQMWNDREARAAWGHMLEAYSFAFASTLLESGPINFHLRQDFVLQPPWDRSLDVEVCEGPERRSCRRQEGHIIQYSGQFDLDGEGESTPSMAAIPGKTAWHFDKRQFTSGAPHLDLGLLPPDLKKKHPVSWKFFEMMAEGVHAVDSLTHDGSGNSDF